jgi:ADP-ribose pyrophosphatase
MNAPRSFENPQVAVGAVVVKDGKILLVKRFKAPHKDLWAIPGGSVELGETLQEAAEREILEETGLTIKAKEPVYTFDLIERESNGNIRFHYVIVDLSSDYIRGKLCAADDAMEAHWFTPEELEHLAMSDSTRNLLQTIDFLSIGDKFT